MNFYWLSTNWKQLPVSLRYISGVNKEQDEVAMTALVMTRMKMLDGNQITMEMFFYIGKKH